MIALMLHNLRPNNINKNAQSELSQDCMVETSNPAILGGVPMRTI